MLFLFPTLRYSNAPILLINPLLTHQALYFYIAPTRRVSGPARPGGPCERIGLLLTVNHPLWSGMNDIQQILERLRYNEEMARKFFEVEVSILSTLNFKDLFERLLTEIKEKFDIPYVWVSLIDEIDVVPLIRELASSDVLKERLSIIGKKAFYKIVGKDAVPLLVNENLKPFYRMFPKNEKYLIRSVAIVPIKRDGEIIGSLNHGDPSGTRYGPGMDTALLERLAVKVSICLSNVTAHEKLKVAASRDPLTGLLNRRVMEPVLKREFTRALRYGAPLSLVFLDLDDFKDVNDSYGHDAGDALLKYFGTHLARMSRESDVVARFAGDEFLLILPSTTEEEARKLTERMEAFFSGHPLELEGAAIPVSFTFGISHLQDTGIQDPPSLLKRADKRLLRAKRGKSRRRGPLRSIKRARE
jgi:diguanylate cyclase (GGDEF)-like protein